MVTLILNPVAGGRNRGAKLYEQLLAFVAQHSLEADVVKTIAPGDGQHLAAVALKKGQDHVVAIGGDGTVNEVLNGILGQGATLGIVPTGTENSIARGLGLPMEWQRALPIALRGNGRDIDVGLAGERAFLGMLGMGAEVDSQGDGRADLARTQDLACTIDAVVQLSCVFCAASITNAATRARYAVPADPIADDGRLELALLTPEHTRMRFRTLDITVPADLALHLDGEIRRIATPLRIGLAPQRQRVLVSGEDRA